ncbi:MAG: glycoside hydrolase family 130 protein [Terriglobia bacterium]
MKKRGIRLRRLFAMATALAGAGGLFAAVHFTLPFGPWNRLSSQPIISPRGAGFESASTFNAAAIEKAGEVVLLYRAQDRHGTSTLGYAVSQDGVHFKRRPEPVFRPEAPYESGGGTEDPRVVKIENTYYLTYTGYNNVNGIGKDKRDAQLCLATSPDLIHWQRQGVILPAYKGKWNVGWTKSGAIVPEKINGKYWMYYLGDATDSEGKMGVASSEDLMHWADALDQPVAPTRAGDFDSKVVEPGPPPVILPEGIFLVYNGADDKLVYSTGWILFDKTDPTRVLARAEKPMFHPIEAWEKVGQVPNVVFVEGLVRRGNRWLFYYGGADKCIGVASAKAK